MSDFGTYLLYGGVAGVALLLSHQSERTRRPFGLALAVTVLSLLVGLRAYSVGIDTDRYRIAVEYFFETRKPYWEVVFSPGYGYFTTGLLSICNSFTFVLLVQSFLTNALFAARFWDFRESSVTFMMFFFVCSSYFYTFNIMAQYLAVALIFFGTRYLDRHRPALFLLFVAMAVAIHNSAIVALLMLLPTVFFGKSKSVARTFLRICAGCIFTVAVSAAYIYLTNRYYGYISNISGLSLGYMAFAQTMVFVFALSVSNISAYARWHWSHDTSTTYRDSRLFYVIYILAGMAAYLVEPAGRIAYYFLPFGANVYGSIAKRSSVSKNCFFVTLILTIWMVLYVWYSCFLNDAGGIIPYQCVLL